MLGGTHNNNQIAIVETGKKRLYAGGVPQKQRSGKTGATTTMDQIPVDNVGSPFTGGGKSGGTLKRKPLLKNGMSGKGENRILGDKKQLLIKTAHEKGRKREGASNSDKKGQMKGGGESEDRASPGEDLEQSFTGRRDQPFGI